VKIARQLRITLGIIATLLACWPCVGILGSFLLPGKDTGSVAGDLAVAAPLAALFAALAAGFTFLARWCFTGRGFKRRKNQEVNQ